MRELLGTLNQACHKSSIRGYIRGQVLDRLYSCYNVSDLPKTITEGNIWLFADGVCHLVAHLGKQVLIDRPQNGINQMSEFCEVNRVSLN